MDDNKKVIQGNSDDEDYGDYRVLGMAIGVCVAAVISTLATFLFSLYDTDYGLLIFAVTPLLFMFIGMFAGMKIKKKSKQ